MRIGVPLETRPGETRVAATPETVKKLIGQGNQVVIQKDAGNRLANRILPMKLLAPLLATLQMHLAQKSC